MKRYVVGFAFTPTENRVALILKVRPAWQRGKFNGVGGHIEAGETPLEAMKREFREETGSDAAWTLFARITGSTELGKDTEPWEVYVFRGNYLGTLESPTDEMVLEVSPDDLPWNVLPNLRWLIPMARAASSRDWPFEILECALHTLSEAL